MKVTQKIIVSMLAVCFIESSHAAVPTCARWYGELDAGDASIHKRYPGTTRQSGPTWNIDVGYKLFRFLGFEVGFTRYPNTHIITTDGVPAFDSHYSYDFAARGIFPVWKSGFELYGKLGIGRLNSSVSISGPTNTDITTRYFYKNGTFLGAGVQYYVLCNLAVGAQWLYMRGDFFTGRIHFYGVGASVLFG